ncbi:MAG: O-antigen ligase family protein [Patescibacteria group bacterium]
MLELLIYALFIWWLINKGYKGFWKTIKHERLLIWGILLLLLGVSIAVLFSWNIRLSAGIWKAWFIDPLLFFMIFVSIIKKDDIKNVFKAMICSGVVVATISLVYLFLGEFNYQGRLQGIFDSPNYLAMYLAVPLLSLWTSPWLSLWTSPKKQLHKDTGQRPSEALPSVSASSLTMRLGLRKVFLPIIFLVLVITLFFTKSFGALLGILAVLGFWLVFNLYNKNKQKLLLRTIFLIFVLVVIIGSVKINSIEGSKSFDARFVIWQQAINVFIEHPLTGIGPGTFEDYFPPYPKWGVPQPHNIFLAFLIQTGLIGFIGFLLILIWFFSSCGRPAVGWRHLVVLCLMVYIFAHGLVDTTYWKNDLSIVFWVIIGLMLVNKKES